MKLPSHVWLLFGIGNNYCTLSCTNTSDLLLAKLISLYEKAHFLVDSVYISKTDLADIEWILLVFHVDKQEVYYDHR